MKRRTGLRTIKSTKRANMRPGMVALIFALGLIVVGITVSALNRRTPVTQQPSKAAPWAQCALNVNITTPTPTTSPKPSASLTPTPTQSTSICKVTFRRPDTPVCWWDQRDVPVTVYLEELPPGGPYHLRLTWRDVLPIPGQDQETVIQNVTAPNTYTLNARWPGVSPFPPYNQTVETHMGVSVYDNSGKPVGGCMDGFDYYWTPYIQCPVPPFPTPLP